MTWDDVAVCEGDVHVAVCVCDDGDDCVDDDDVCAAGDAVPYS
jgi:hypothetical protein